MPKKNPSAGWLSRLAAVLCCVLMMEGCAITGGAPEKVYPPGATVDVGNLSYSISNPVWSDSLQGDRGPRVPTHRFLTLTVSASNKSSDPVTMPLLTLIDGSGQQYLELDNGEGLSNWLGLFRKIAAQGTEGGEILFDVPGGKGPYKLRVSSGGDVEKEITALIEVQDEKATQPSGPLAPTAGQ